MTRFDATIRPVRAANRVALLLVAAFLHTTSAFGQGTDAMPFLCRDGAGETYTVPADVTQLYVITAGAAGGSTAQTKPVASGATVSAVLPVEPGQTLNVVVGCAGRRAADSTGGAGGAGYGHGGDGGRSAFELSNGAGGGGASAVFHSDTGPLLVAGGGGGSGGYGGRKSGGNGGKGSRKGGNGAKGVSGGAGGKGAASSSADGAAGFRNPFAGSGGGGGGGYGGTKPSPSGPPVFLGGGGGGDIAEPKVIGGGGGGGGGASFAATAAVKPRFGTAKGPKGDGFALIAPYKPWKPAPAVFIFSCKKGKPQSFTVPTGVQELIVVASGATGGRPFNGTPAEGGARVVGRVPVSAGSKLSVIAGCQGLANGAGGKGFVAGGAGVSGGLSGGGGGSSALLNGSTPLLVAGGGTGGGGAGGAGGSGGGSAAACGASVTCDPVEAGVNRVDGTVLVMAVPTAALTVPDPPTNVAATVGLEQATVTFTAPVDTGNSPITSYTVSATNDDVSATGSGSPITLTGLSQGGTYAFTVTATNAKGTSVASLPSNSVTIPQPPSQPVTVSALAGNGQATVSFDPPEDDGDSPITGYTVTATPGGNSASGAGSPLTVTGLTNGTSYTFSVMATNAVGSGPPATSNAVTPQP
jgi:hypothetical protein